MCNEEIEMIHIILVNLTSTSTSHIIIQTEPNVISYYILIINFDRALPGLNHFEREQETSYNR